MPKLHNRRSPTDQYGPVCLTTRRMAMARVAPVFHRKLISPSSFHKDDTIPDNCSRNLTVTTHQFQSRHAYITLNSLYSVTQLQLQQQVLFYRRVMIRSRKLFGLFKIGRGERTRTSNGPVFETVTSNLSDDPRPRGNWSPSRDSNSEIYRA